MIQLDTQDRSAKFAEDDLKLLVGVTNQASIALENTRLHQNVVDQERAKRNMELAHQVQFSFLPRSTARSARLRVLCPLRAGVGSRRRLL